MITISYKNKNFHLTSELMVVGTTAFTTESLSNLNIKFYKLQAGTLLKDGYFFSCISAHGYGSKCRSM